MSGDEDDVPLDEEAAAAAVAVVDEVEDDDEEDDEVVATASVEGDEMTIQSTMTNDDETAGGTPTTAETKKAKGGKRKRGGPPPGSRKGRTPAVRGLTIPFRAIKRTMKMDPDIGTVQNEAAIMTTLAAELFIKSLATQSIQNAKNKGRNTIRYEDVAEARTKDPALGFLDKLIP